jgi:hypothetical protein
MAGHGDEIAAAAAAGRGHLRASHADREQTVNVLKVAFVQGRLAKDEFDLRLSQALAARTYADLSTVTADLPAGLVSAAPPEPARDPDNRAVLKVIAALTAVCMCLWVAKAVSVTDGSNSPGSTLFFVLMVLIVTPGMPAALLLLHARLEKRAGRQSPQGLPPSAGGRASRRAAGHPGRKLPPAGPRHTAYLSALAR